ncbi:serine hydrolase [Sphingobacterium sp. SGG-5]|uniref:serine hydrolase domain-containing protein n=1 Tax=Sphingobacterium sp. SGG-5 TaxID=2710881 RepID=UPI0013EA0152|nr:serine hydrolase domain-containing protein [Sphingobacterium sp. SGG-5]NGM62322.1 serine hydrolase [Sphingobacterium sp. SGG-5]
MKRLARQGICWFIGWVFFTIQAQGQAVRSIDNHTVLVYNRGGIIPFTQLDNRSILVVTPRKTSYANFISRLGRYTEIAETDFSSYTEDTKPYNTIILAGKTAELTADILLKARQSANLGKQVIVCTFVTRQQEAFLSSPRFGGQLTELLAVGWGAVEQQNMAMSLFGGMAITQGLPANKTTYTRIQYAHVNPTAWDIGGLTKKIDEIAAEAIQQRATPGMVVMALKNNQVIFEKAYGYHTYDKKVPTRLSDIFDLASVSKIAATTPVAMHLYESGKIDLDKTIGDYLAESRETNKADITVRRVLLHEAGFIPYIPFYRELKTGDLQSYPSPTHQVKVADQAYLLTDYYRQVMWPEMLKSPVKPVGNYVYSDISMYVMKEIIEQVSGTALDTYVARWLYKPLGMKTAGYNPRERFDKDRIVPTEQDMIFRKTLLTGYVHDQGAAMAGGIAGHAGLFATANDLAIYGQLLLNRGKYGGIRYFQGATVDLFTSRQSEKSRRGLGFDRYDPDSKDGYPSRLSNNSVYGHTGYTGTCIWMDPQNQLVYIFLSNRVHPQVTSKLSDLNIRSRIQDAIYETILPKI